MVTAALTHILKNREHLVGAAVGSGMTAAAAEEGNVDLILALSAGYFRLHGASSAASLLPYANANELSWDAAIRHVMPRITRTPVLIGTCAQDPLLDLDAYLARVKQYGIAGVTNFPSVGFYDGKFREAIESSGLGFDREVEMLKRAKQAGLLTIGFCLDAAAARLFAQAGVDILCLNLGLAEWRTVDLSEHQAALDRAIESIRTMIKAAKQSVAQPYCVIFGGPVLLPQDTAQVYHTDAGRPVRGGGGLLPDVVVPGIASVPVWWSAADDSDFDAAVADSVALTLPATPAGRAAWLNSPAEWKVKLVPPFLARVRSRFHVTAVVDSVLEFQIAATLARDVANVRWGPDAAEEFSVNHSADVRAALEAFPQLPALLAAPKH